MTKVVNYISEAFEELKSNVTWPAWPEVQRLTIVVAVEKERSDSSSTQKHEFDDEQDENNAQEFVPYVDQDIRNSLLVVSSRSSPRNADIFTSRFST